MQAELVPYRQDLQPKPQHLLPLPDRETHAHAAACTLHPIHRAISSIISLINHINFINLINLRGRFPKYLVTNLVTNVSPNLVMNLVNHQIW